MHIEARSINVVGAWVLTVADAMRAAAERSTGMAGGGPAALVAVAAEPGLTIDALRRALGLTHPGTVRLVDRLAERGWVVRDPGVGRSVSLRVTAAGLAARDELLAAREAAVAEVLDGLDSAAHDRLVGMLEPMLVQRVGDELELRRLCRLCDRVACRPCPPWTALSEDPDTAGTERG